MSTLFSHLACLISIFSSIKHYVNGAQLPLTVLTCPLQSYFSHRLHKNVNINLDYLLVKCIANAIVVIHIDFHQNRLDEFAVRTLRFTIEPIDFQNFIT